LASSDRRGVSASQSRTKTAKASEWKGSLDLPAEAIEAAEEERPVVGAIEVLAEGRLDDRAGGDAGGRAVGGDALGEGWFDVRVDAGSADLGHGAAS
jgi:hypothetical protein